MPGPPPAVAAIRSAVRTALRSVDPQRGSLVLAAVSGGADSLALAAALAFEAPRAGLRAGAVVVDHRLQADSAQVAARAAEQCRSLGLAPVAVRAVHVRDAGDGPEMAARTARHDALRGVAAETGAVAVLLGHTADDQAEQVLLGLLRGSGARALGGMAPVSGLLVRPLLGVTRDQTQQACAAAGLTPHHDPHNADERFTRVRARHLLGELEQRLGPGVRPGLVRTADLLREDDAALTELTEQHLAALTDPRRVPVELLAGLPRALRSRLVHRVLRDAGAGDGLARTHVLEVLALVERWHGQGPVDVPGGLQVQREDGGLVVGPRRPVE